MKIWKFIKKVIETEEKSSNIPQEKNESGQPEKQDEQGSQSSNQVEETSRSKKNQQSETTKPNDNIETSEDTEDVESEDSTQEITTEDNQESSSSTKQNEIEEDQSSIENNNSLDTQQGSSSDNELSEPNLNSENQQEEYPSSTQNNIVENQEENQSSQNEMDQQLNNESHQQNPLFEESNEINPNSEYDDEEEEDEIEDESTQKEKIKLEKEPTDIEESEEPPHELSEESNNFLNQLNELPSFEERNRGNGYSIDTKSKTEIPESVVRTLITKFLNQRFCRKNSDLNIRSSSLEKSDGFYKWDVKKVIIDSKTHQLNKVLNDKYSYEYAEGQGDNVPLSFYFDMSGSMSKYTNMLATIAIELLKKNVKVLIGFNERVNVQIDSIDKNITVEELSRILTSAGYSSWGYSNKDSFIKDSRVKYKYIDRNIDNYLLEKKAEKCVVFSDFDPLSEVVNLSQKVQTYWFCFERNFNRSNLNKYNGFLYSVQNPEDILDGLVMVNGKRFETLCYVDNPKQLQKRRS